MKIPPQGRQSRAMRKRSRSARDDGENVGPKVTAVATAAIIFAVMPSFLVGASGVLLRGELGFGEAGLGFGVSVFFGLTASTSVLGGRLVERIGGRRAMILIGLASASVLLAIAAFARSLTHLVILLAVGGVVNGIAQPASNLILAQGVMQRQALMFGIKQAAVPFTTLLAGVSVPLVGLTVGWRWSFVIGAVTALCVAPLAAHNLSGTPTGTVSGNRGRGMRTGDAAVGPLVAFAIAAGAGMSAATSMGSFLVESATAGGMAVGLAGWVQVVGSLSGAGARILAGWLADRFRGTAMIVSSVMLLAGAGGYVMLALGGTPIVFLGAVVAYAFGWGWSGLMMFAVVRFNPNAPAAATGIVMVGSGGGAAVVPFLFGLVVERASFEAAWLLAASLALLSAALMFGARRWLLTDRARRAAATEPE